MADTVQQQIIDALKTALETITVANDYETDIGKNVVEWQVIPHQADNLPALEIRDTGEDISEVQNLHEHGLRLEITVFFGGSTAPAEIRAMVGDIYACLGSYRRLADAVYRLQPDGYEIEVEQTGAIYGSATLKYMAWYMTEEFDAYNAV